ncbi:MAG: glycosyltransferase family 4 protein [Patescibacteria group bacterium]
MIDKNKKIFIAADIFPPQIGGPASYSYDLAKKLTESGYLVSVLSYGHVHEKKPKADFKIYKVSIRWPLPIRYIFYFIRLFFLAYNFDVIYAQGPVASGLPSLWVSHLLDKRFIVKVVGDYSWEQAQLGHKTMQGVDDWQKKPEYKETSIGKTPFLIYIQKLVVKGADVVITPSHYLKKIVMSWGAKEDRIQVIYNSISLSNKIITNKDVAKKKIGVSGDILISVGRLVPWKHFDFLIRLMPEFLQINSNFKLIIVGDGPELRQYQKIVADLNLLEKVFLPGRMSKEKLSLYFSSSEFFLLNSSYEGLSHLILEAMAHNLPIIVSDVGGNSEIIENEINGFLVPHNNKKAWIDAVKSVWEDKKLRLRLSNQPTPKLPCFNFDELVKRTLEVLLKED